MDKSTYQNMIETINNSYIKKSYPTVAYSYDDFYMFDRITNKEVARVDCDLFDGYCETVLNGKVIARGFINGHGKKDQQVQKIIDTCYAAYIRQLAKKQHKPKTR